MKMKTTVEQYDLMRMSHFADKLEILIDNCPRTSLNEDTPLRVSVPHFQTKDAIEQLKLHLEKLLEQNEKKKISQDEKDRRWRNWLRYREEHYPNNYLF